MTLELKNREQWIRAIQRLGDVSQHRDIAKQSSVNKDVEFLTQMLASFQIASKTIKEPPPGEDVDAFNQRYLEHRVSLLERKLGMQPSEEIEDRIKAAFSNTPIIEKIYVKPEQTSIPLIIVYNSGSIADAIEQIQPGIIKLEDEFPNMHFEPHIFHANEIHEGHHRQAKLILGR